jgi:esterase/lipase superfamily enzyme
VERRYHRWFSPNLGRDMELLVFGHGGARVLVFPTRQGRFFDYEDWGMVQALAPTIEAGNLQLYCVDSVDGESLYCSWRHPADRIGRHRQYEAYLLHEVLPLMRSGNPFAFLIAHGCSIGAYHAATLALRNPGVFGKLVALSGRYDLTKAVGPFTDLFDGFYNQDIYFHTPTHFLPGVQDEWTLDAYRRMQIVLAIGESDPFLQSTAELSSQMAAKGISHELAVWKGEAHRPKYWRQMVGLYL